MSTCRTLEDIKQALFDRGTLPSRIRLVCGLGDYGAGESFVWSEEHTGFVSESDGRVYLAAVVRARWGQFFVDAVSFAQFRVAA